MAIDDRRGGVALWVGNVKGGVRKLRLNLDAVYVAPNPTKTWRGWWLAPAPPSGIWREVIAGAPPRGPYVRAVRTGATGVDEGVSPVPLAGELQ